MPQVVLEETTADRSRPGAADIAAFVQTYAQAHPGRDDAIYVAAATHLDEGEAQVLSLAYVLECGVLMDERRGRQTAIRQNIPLFGTLGVLLQAKRMGRIERIETILDRIQTNGYRISQTLVKEALMLANELP
ncbi:MAG: DUF3368 domain-containing protein [Zoogloeaceae bacterium]|nr:DUF3368 domain-containing protein [Zoogloeaceae bacterium]